MFRTKVEINFISRSIIFSVASIDVKSKTATKKKLRDMGSSKKEISNPLSKKANGNKINIKAKRKLKKLSRTWAETSVKGLTL
jgi:hypothetical protein